MLYFILLDTSKSDKIETLNKMLQFYLQKLNNYQNIFDNWLCIHIKYYQIIIYYISVIVVFNEIDISKLLKNNYQFL